MTATMEVPLLDDAPRVYEDSDPQWEDEISTMVGRQRISKGIEAQCFSAMEVAVLFGCHYDSLSWALQLCITFFYSHLKFVANIQRCVALVYRRGALGWPALVCGTLVPSIP